MPAAYYIACDFPPNTTNNGVWNRCRTDESEVMTEQQVIDIYAVKGITQEQYMLLAQEVPVFFAIAFLIKLCRKVMGA